MLYVAAAFFAPVVKPVDETATALSAPTASRLLAICSTHVTSSVSSRSRHSTITRTLDEPIFARRATSTSLRERDLRSTRYSGEVTCIPVPPRYFFRLATRTSRSLPFLSVLVSLCDSSAYRGKSKARGGHHCIPGHSRGTGHRGKAVANGHQRSIRPQVNGQMAPAAMLDVEEIRPWLPCSISTKCGGHAQTGPRLAVVVCLVRTGSASHREPLVVGGHQRSRSAAENRRSRAVTPPTSTGEAAWDWARAPPPAPPNRLDVCGAWICRYEIREHQHSARLTRLVMIQPAQPRLDIATARRSMLLPVLLAQYRR
jgi:hypothetical protein